jgi:GT2 family glycosyltransferase
MAQTVPVSVVVPTIGRRDLLRACLDSIAGCSPRAADVVVVDQSRNDDVRTVVASFAPGVACVRDEGRGIARAINAGLRAARHAVVCVTNDDCTVDRSWVGEAWRAATATPGGIVTGRVLPAGDPDGTPSTKTDPEPHDYTGEEPKWVLYGGNMVLPRDDVLALGGFDERAGLLTAAEDNDFCYRWMVARRPLRYDPTLVVWHHDWRTPAELQRRYATYARGQGVFYAKHLAAGDARLWRAVREDVRRGLRAHAVALRRRSWREPDEARALAVGVPIGLVRGWREARRLTRARRHDSSSAG